MLIKTRFKIYRVLRRLLFSHKLAYWITMKVTRPTPMKIESGWVRDSENAD